MARLTGTIMLTAALLSVAACGKKKVKDIPPPPGGTADGSLDGSDGRGTGTIIPGSQQDFLARVTSDRVFFATDEDVLDAEDRTILDSQVAWLQQYASKRVTIEGHCDERGTRDYNIALGDRRANAAKNYLVSRGVAASRISTISYGKERPAALGSDETSWAQNRRAVTLTVQ